MEHQEQFSFQYIGTTEAATIPTPATGTMAARAASTPATGTTIIHS